MPLKQKLRDDPFPFHLTTFEWDKFSRALDVMSMCRHAQLSYGAFAREVQIEGKQVDSSLMK